MILIKGKAARAQRRREILSEILAAATKLASREPLTDLQKGETLHKIMALLFELTELMATIDTRTRRKL